MIPYGDRPAKAALGDCLGVEGIPTLAVLRVADGKVETTDAVGKVMGAPGDFPWPARAWTTLDDAGGAVNDFPFLVALADGADDAALVAARDALDAAAAPFFVAGAPSDKLRFILATPADEMAGAVRGWLGRARGAGVEWALAHVQKGKRAFLPAGATAAEVAAWAVSFVEGKVALEDKE